jgi:antitoxin YefM
VIETSYKYARNNLNCLIKRVNSDLEAIMITTDQHNAILVSESHYNGMMETLYLLQSSTNAQHLAQAIEDVEVGNTIKVVHDIKHS